MEEFWLIIGLILTGCVVLLTYYLAVVLKELAERLKESKSVVANVDEITANALVSQKKITSAVDSLENIAVGVEETFAMLKDQVLVPFTFMMSFIEKIKGYVGPKDVESEVKE